MQFLFDNYKYAHVYGIRVAKWSSKKFAVCAECRAERPIRTFEQWELAKALSQRAEALSGKDSPNDAALGELAIETSIALFDDQIGAERIRAALIADERESAQNATPYGDAREAAFGSSAAESALALLAALLHEVADENTWLDHSEDGSPIVVLPAVGETDAIAIVVVADNLLTLVTSAEDTSGIAFAPLGGLFTAPHEILRSALNELVVTADKYRDHPGWGGPAFLRHEESWEPYSFALLTILSATRPGDEDEEDPSSKASSSIDDI